MKELRFYKAPKGTWWLDSEDYIAGGGDPRELQMVAGADDLLELLADGKDEVKLQVSTKKVMPFSKEFYELKRCDEIPTVSGRYYFDDNSDLLMWLCDVTQWIFGGIFPETIWYKKI